MNNADSAKVKIVPLANVVEVPPPEWRDLLLRGENGVRPILANVCILLRHHPELRNLVSYNCFSYDIELRRHAPWERNKDNKKVREWIDKDDIFLAEFAQRHDIRIRPDVASQAVRIVADDRIIHPVRDKLAKLTWDGEQRVDKIFTTYFGASGPATYLAEVARAFLVGAVARVQKPGCKLDTMPILEGLQGTLKSTALRELFGERLFTDDISDIGSKDAAGQLQGKWVIEIAELDAMNRAETERLKAWLSRATDRYRPVYERKPREFPRQCVIVGTTNRDLYLKDETGGRRFLPVRCGRIEIEALKRDKYQIWAEATAMYRAGTPWWITAAAASDATDEQDQRFNTDPWQDIISEHVAGLAETSVRAILEGPLKLDPARQDQHSQTRAARVLTRLGWVKTQRRRHGVRTYVYVRPAGDSSPPSPLFDPKG